MLAISVGLILAMLVARSSVNTKIDEVKATTATQITINPAGVMGGMGGGDPLTADQVAKIKNTAHISSITSTLSDQLSTENTNLTPSLELGKRMLRMSTDGGNTVTETPAADSTNSQTRTPPITVTGTATPTTTVAKDKLTSGAMIDGNSSELAAIVGKTLAEKNNLSVGSTFTMYGKTITVKGIYSLDNKFQDSSIVMPITTVQNITDQAGAVSSVTATVDSSDNVASTTSALKSTLGDKADVTSEEEKAKSSLEPLESIASLALGGVIAATVAGGVIILLAMIMIVRERRREIGVIKAIGGTNKKVISQFVSEALTLTVIGSIVGLGLGVLVSGPMTQSLVSNQSSNTSNTGISSGGPSRGGAGPRIIGGFEGAGNQLKTNLTSVTSTVTPQTFAFSGAIILLIAVVGSAIPAWAIARVRPAEVLRAE